MIVRRMSSSELYHHGINGQKWGIKHGPPYPLGNDVSTGAKLKKTSKTVIKRAKKVEKNIKKTDEKYHISDRTKTIIKAALITAGVLTLAGAAAYGYNLNRKMLKDTTLNGIKMRRYQGYANFDTTDGGSSYISTGLMDKLQYKKYAADMHSNYKLDIRGDNLKIPSIKNSRNIFSTTLKDEAIKNDLKETFSKNLAYYKGQKMTPPNRRRVALFKEAIKRIDNPSDKDMKILYDAWNTSITNNSSLSGWDTTNKIFDVFKKNGYNTIWDTHDLYISGYHSKNPMIVFDKTNLTLESSKRINDTELKIGKIIGNLMTGKNNYNSIVHTNNYRPIKVYNQVKKQKGSFLTR